MYGLGVITPEEQRAKLQQKISRTETILARVSERIPTVREKPRQLQTLRKRKTQAKTRLTRLRSRLASLTPPTAPLTIPPTTPIPPNGYWSDTPSVPSIPILPPMPEGTPVPPETQPSIFQWFTENPLAVYVIGGILLFMLLPKRG